MKPPGFDYGVMALLPLAGQPLTGRVVQRLTLRSQLGLEIAPQDNIRAPACHVGGNSDHAGSPRLGDNLGLLLVVLGIQHFMFDALFLKRLRQLFRGLDRRRTDQNGSATIDTSAHIVDDGLKLFVAGQVDQIIEIIATHGHVSGNHHAVQSVDLPELKRLSIRGTGHTRQLVVKAEEVLKCRRGEGLALALNLHTFFRLDRLMQTF